MNIEINKIGKIIKGDDIGHFVKIINDSENTGGYLILISKHQDMQTGYDNWVENEETLLRFIEESHWLIEWT